MKSFVVIDSFNFVLIAASVAVKSDNFDDVFFSILDKMIDRLQNDHWGSTFFAVWDEAGGTQFRKDIDHHYKDNRVSKVVEFKTILSVKPLFEMKGIKNISLEKTEADDTIYCLCKILREKYKSGDITIVSRDRDLIQVVQKEYANRLYDYSKKEYIKIPWYPIVEYKALVGDSSDHILGVKGIGKKKASQLLSEYIVTNKLDLTEDQRSQFEKCLLLVDSSLHPRFEENQTKLKEKIRDEIY